MHRLGDGESYSGTELQKLKAVKSGLDGQMINNSGLKAAIKLN